MPFILGSFITLMRFTLGRPPGLMPPAPADLSHGRGEDPGAVGGDDGAEEVVEQVQVHAAGERTRSIR
jgi:hypothetical protein